MRTLMADLVMPDVRMDAYIRRNAQHIQYILEAWITLALAIYDLRIFWTLFYACQTIQAYRDSTLTTICIRRISISFHTIAVSFCF